MPLPFAQLFIGFGITQIFHRAYDLPRPGLAYSFHLGRRASPLRPSMVQ
jgi:hypothetical protein